MISRAILEVIVQTQVSVDYKLVVVIVGDSCLLVLLIMERDTNSMYTNGAIRLAYASHHLFVNRYRVVATRSSFSQKNNAYS